MRHSTTGELLNYWNTLRSNRPAPLRPEFEPSAIGNILGSIFMLEITCDIATIRLAGGTICSMFGKDLRGKAFAKLWLNGVERKPSSIIKRCIDGTAPYLLNADGLTRAGSVSELEILIVPLKGTDGQSDRVIGSISDLNQSNAFAKPHILGMSLTSIKQVERDTIPVNFGRNRRTGIIKTSKTGTFASKAHKNANHLYIIDGGVKT